MENKKKLIILSSIIVGVLVVVLGLSYALFTFDRSGTNQELVLGDIWMKYTESNGISLENALPGNDYSKYFEFTITGKNTYAEKDIWYDIRLTKGDVPDDRTEDDRIEDQYLKFKLVEINGDEEIEIFTDKTYDNLSNQTIHVATIPKRANEYSKTYRLYMVISEKLTIGNVEGAISSSEFETLFGSIKVATTGDFVKKSIENITDFKNLLLSYRKNTIVEDLDGTIYISGSKDDYDQLTLEDVDYNYVWYSGKLWRITAINPDGSMKMITEDVITVINWGQTSTISTTDLTSSYPNSWAREWLNQEFLPTLYNYENILVKDSKWNSTTSIDKTKPLETTITLDYVGMLSAYEYPISFQNTSSSATGYLNNGYNWWLLTPYDSSKVRVVYSAGYWYTNDPFAGNGIRPVVNVKDNIKIIDGNGSIYNPFRLNGDIEEPQENITLLNTRVSGEYVKLEGDTTKGVFRIVDKEIINDKLTTKLVLNDYVKEEKNPSNELLIKTFSNSTQYELWNEVDRSNETYWRGYLNNTWLQKIDSTYNKTNDTSSMLEKGLYYLGINKSSSYKTTVCSIVNSNISIKKCIENGDIVNDVVHDDYVGLLRVGEMFASITNEYTTNTTHDMWLITPMQTSIINQISPTGYITSSYSSEDASTVSPSINLTSTIVIKSGSGTKNNPFVVGLSN